MSRWHTEVTGIPTDSSLNDSYNLPTDPQESALFGATLEKLEQCFYRLSDLDNVRSWSRKDLDPEAGSVHVATVGRLQKTAEGFLMIALLSQPKAGATGKAEVFEVNQRANTVRASSAEAGENWSQELLAGPAGESTVTLDLSRGQVLR
jgi:hypothetical protein